MAIDYQDVKTLTKFVQDNVPTGRFLSSFFTVEALRTLDAELDVVTGTKKILPFKSEGANKTRVGRGGYSKHKFHCYAIDVERATTAMDCFKAQPGEPSAIIDPMDPNERQSLIIGNDQAELSDGINRTIETLCAKALFDGKYDIIGEGGIKIDDIDFGFESSHKVTRTGTSAWGGNAADVVGDIDTLIELAGKTGRTCKDLVFGSKVWALARKNEAFMKEFDRIHVTGNSLDMSNGKDGRGASLKGTYNGCRIWTYGDEYIPSNGGDRTAIVPTNKVLAIGEGASLKLKFGCVGNPKDGWFVGERFAKMSYDEKAEEMILNMKSRPLPVVEEANAIAVGTFCTP